MNKEYIEPSIELIRLKLADIITDSDGTETLPTGLNKSAPQLSQSMDDIDQYWEK